MKKIDNSDKIIYSVPKNQYCCHFDCGYKATHGILKTGTVPIEFHYFCNEHGARFHIKEYFELMMCHILDASIWSLNKINHGIVKITKR